MLSGSTALRDLSMSNVSSPDTFDLSEYRRELRTTRFGHPTEYWSRVNSTNDKILDMARRGAPEGTVAVADEQTAGRGRLGSVWHSPPGVGIWASILLRPRNIPTEDLPPLTLCAASAIAAAIEEYAEVQTQIKWPNDVLINNRKVAGMLMEAKNVPGRGIQDEGPCVILGIGINVNQTRGDFPKELQETAVSIQMEKGKPVSRELLFRRVLERLEPIYRQFLASGFSSVLPDIKPRLAWRGRFVELSDGPYTVRGTVLDIEEDGGLLIDAPEQGWVVMYSGSIRLIR